MNSTSDTRWADGLHRPRFSCAGRHLEPTDARSRQPRTPRMAFGALRKARGRARRGRGTVRKACGSVCACMRGALCAIERVEGGSEGVGSGSWMPRWCGSSKNLPPTLSAGPFLEGRGAGGRSPKGRKRGKGGCVQACLGRHALQRARAMTGEDSTANAAITADLHPPLGQHHHHSRVHPRDQVVDEDSPAAWDALPSFGWRGLDDVEDAEGEEGERDEHRGVPRCVRA